jgi:GrpB-like predicted nucleotidyltransferase (UPF0157 family)
LLDEPIHLASPVASWAESAEVERTRLAGALGIPSSQVEHIGSTAVPGLLAKPIIDLQVGVHHFPPTTVLQEALVGSGYVSHGEAGVPGRLYFTSRHMTSFNVHVVQFGGIHWVNNLLLREYLASSVEARRIYESAKLAALEAGATTLLAYSSAKAAVVSQLIAQARAARGAG